MYKKETIMMVAKEVMCLSENLEKEKRGEKKRSHPLPERFYKSEIINSMWSLQEDEIRVLRTVTYLGKMQDYFEGTPDEIFNDYHKHIKSEEKNRKEIIDELSAMNKIHEYLKEGYRSLNIKL